MAPIASTLAVGAGYVSMVDFGNFLFSVWNDNNSLFFVSFSYLLLLQLLLGNREIYCKGLSEKVSRSYR